MHCLIFFLFYLLGWQNKLPLSSLTDNRTMLCLLRTMLASDNNVRHSSSLLKMPQQDRAQKNPKPDMNANDPYRWGRPIFDGLIPRQSFGADEISEIQIYLLDSAEQLLGVGF